MKKYFLFILLLAGTTFSRAQTDSKNSVDEMAIRKLEEAGRIAMMTQDTLAMYTLVSPDYVVMNPNHQIHGFRELIELLTMWKKGNAAMKGTPPRIEHVIEKITINKDIAIVMGQDIPAAGATGPGGSLMSTLTYTNVYRRYLTTWQLIARQNSPVCQ